MLNQIHNKFIRAWIRLKVKFNKTSLIYYFKVFLGLLIFSIIGTAFTVLVVHTPVSLWAQVFADMISYFVIGLIIYLAIYTTLPIDTNFNPKKKNHK